ncbi:MAG: PAS-domain containing protein [Alphaproteobacteria bacterium]|nr:PAS-domain containing protein [Alphaproteobacteria bacterium]
MSEGISVVGPDGRLAAMNDRARCMLNLPEALAAPGSDVLSILRFLAARGDYGAVDLEGEARRRFAQLMSCRQDVSWLHRVPSGATIRVRRRRMPDDMILSVYTDVSDQLSIEDALRRSQEWAEERSRILQASLDALQEGIAAVDPSGRLLTWNEQFVKILALPPELVAKGKPYRAIIRFGAERGDFGPVADPDAEADRRLNSALRGESESFTLRTPGRRFVEFHRGPMRDGGFLVVFVDTTERKRAEDRLRDAVGAMADQLFIWDADDRLVATNATSNVDPGKGWELTPLGIRFEDAIRARLNAGQFALPAGTDPESFIADRLARHRSAAPVDFELTESDGRIYIVRERRMPDGGRVVSTTDITAQKEAERRALASEARFRAFAEAASDWYWEQDDQLRFTYISAKVAGEGVEPFIGLTRRATMPLDVTEEQWARHDALLAARSPIRDFRFARLDEHGRKRRFAISGNPVQDQAGRFCGYRGVGRDITELQEAQARAEAQAADLAAMLDVMVEGICILDAAGHVRSVSRRYRELHGVDETALHPGVDYRDVIRLRAQRGDFGAVDVEGTVRARMALINEGSDRDRIQVVQAGQVREVTRRRLADGGRAIVVRDVTDQHRAEQRLRDALDALADRFALWGPDDRLVMTNFGVKGLDERQWYALDDDTTFAESFRRRTEAGDFVIPQGMSKEEFIALRLRRHSEASGEPFEVEYASGQVSLVRERRTAEGAVAVVSTDVTSEKRAELRLRDAIAAMADHFVLYDQEDRLVMTNMTLAGRTQADGAGLMDAGRRFEEIFRERVEAGIYRIPDGETKEAYVARRLAAHTDPKGVDIEAEQTDGRIFSIRERSTREGGRVILRSDITDRRRSERRLQDAIDAIGDLLYIWDADDRLVTMTARHPLASAIQALGVSPGITFEDAFRRFIAGGYVKLPEGIRTEDFVAERLRAHRSAEPVEFEHIDRDGRNLVIRERRTSEGGKAVIVTDVTRLKQAEQRLSDAINAMADRFYLWDAQDRLVLTNTGPGSQRGDSCTALLTPGMSFEEWQHALARAGLVTVPPRATVESEIARRMEQRKVGIGDDRETENAEGRKFIVRERRTTEGGIVAVASDVTALRRAETRFREAIEALADRFYVWGADDRLIVSNAAGPAWGGDSGATLVRAGMTFEECVRALAAAGRFKTQPGETIDDVIQRRLEHHRRRDGSDLEIENADGVIFTVRERQTAEGGTVVVATDVTQSKRVARELLQARDTAEAANRAKTEFLSRMSHELRTPMNAILGFSQLLLMQTKGALSEGQAEYVRHVNRSGEHLLKLIDEVLDLARIEGGTLGLRRESVSAAAVLDELKATMAPIAGKAGIALEVAADATGLPPVLGDRTRIMQVLLNLASNAIKYNRPAGRVTVACYRPSPDFVRFSVSDTGLGIPRERQAELFQPFNRLGKEGGPIEGTGIGLAICRQLVALMGGSLGFSSERDQGSRFWFDLPADPTREAPVSPVGEAGGWRSLGGDRAKPFCILYIEDNPSNRDLMANILEGLSGTRMLSAPDAGLGLDIAVTQLPDLVIMDINLPGMDGYAALKQLRATPETRHIPVIAVSAAAMPHDVERGARAGFARYLAKPLQVREVMETVLACLADVRTSRSAGRAPSS